MSQKRIITSNARDRTVKVKCNNSEREWKKKLNKHKQNSTKKL